MKFDGLCARRFKKLFAGVAGLFGEGFGEIGVKRGGYRIEERRGEEKKE